MLIMRREVVIVNNRKIREIKAIMGRMRGKGMNIAVMMLVMLESTIAL